MELLGPRGPEALAGVAATWAPSTATMRNSWPARTGQARPERIGTMKRSTSVRDAIWPASRS